MQDAGYVTLAPFFSVRRNRSGEGSSEENEVEEHEVKEQIPLLGETYVGFAALRGSQTLPSVN